MSLFGQFRSAHRPTLTEENLPDQTGKVFMVTGGAVGVGFELVKMLYQKNGVVYIATRSQDKMNAAIQRIKTECSSSRGRLEALVLDLADLSSIKPAADMFLANETRLDVLFHNAGVMVPPAGSVSKQGHELQLATNTLGPFLLSKLLEPVLTSTAESSPRGTVRIVWVASVMSFGTPDGGVQWDGQAPRVFPSQNDNYMESKAGQCFLASEYSSRFSDRGIVSLSVHPGLIQTELQRHMPGPVRALMKLIFPRAIYGAYTELFAGLSPDIKSEDNGGYVIPWGQMGTLPAHLTKNMVDSSAKFWNWCEKVTAEFC